MGRLFGTDGVRGLANSFLTPELAFDLGRAGAYVLTKKFKHSPKIVIGTDTRLSGDMLKAALTAGMTSVGASVTDAGNIPTPAIAYIAKKHFDAGVMISASHNKFCDNGIKFFSSDGFKLSDELENEIEEYIFDKKSEIPRSVNEDIGTFEICEYFLDDYTDYLVETAEGTKLGGLKIALDCSNGATFESAPLVFHMLDADVFVTANEPDGININDGVGSTHIEHLTEFVKECGADVGFAFDGDGDRLICVDENGNVVDGDMVMSILAHDMKNNGKLNKNTVVATVMSNLGFFNGCQKHDIETVATKVGDRYVLEKMLEDGYNIGGEQSGHIILTDYGTTGDGTLTAVQLAKCIKLSGKKLSELNTVMKLLPQVLVNAKIPNDKKQDCMVNPEIAARIKELEQKYSGSGRVLTRPSGTEALVRVMIEGENLEEIGNDAKELAGFMEAYYN